MQEGRCEQRGREASRRKGLQGVGLGDGPGVEGAMPRWEGSCVAGHSGSCSEQGHFS